MFEKYKEAIAAKKELEGNQKRLKKIKEDISIFDRNLTERKKVNDRSLREQIDLTKSKKELRKEIDVLEDEIEELEERIALLKQEEKSLQKPETKVEEEKIEVPEMPEIVNPLYTLETIEDQLHRYYQAFMKDYDVSSFRIVGMMERLIELLYEDHFRIMKYENRIQREYYIPGPSDGDMAFPAIKPFFDFLENKGYPVYQNLNSFVRLFFSYHVENEYQQKLYKYPFLHNLQPEDRNPEKMARLFLINEGVDASIDYFIFWYAAKKFGFAITYEEISEKLDEQRKILKIERLERNAKEITEEEKALQLSQINFDILSGTDFEIYVGNVLQKLGFNVTQTKGSGDQGVDLIALKNDKKYAIQTKRYSANVSNTAIQEAVAGKDYYKADYAWVVTNSDYTKGAIEIAQATNTLLWNGNKLKEMIEFADY